MDAKSISNRYIEFCSLPNNQVLDLDTSTTISFFFQKKETSKLLKGPKKKEMATLVYLNMCLDFNSTN